MNNGIRFACACFLMAGVPAVAQAFSFIECAGAPQKWGSNSVSIRSHNTGFPSGSTWLTSLQAAVNAWNRNPSNVRFALGSTNGPVFPGNFTSEAYFSSDDNLLNGAPALAVTLFNCVGGMVEVDVVVDNRIAWTTSTSKSAQNGYSGSSRFITATLGHELGHVLGLAHTNDTYNSMGQDWTHVHTNGSTARFYSGEDAANGLVALYGARSSGQDLGVVHWRLSGANGEYSTHARTRVFSDADGSELAKITAGREPYYAVRSGQRVRVEFTFENNGVSRQTSSDVEFVLSTNDTISTADTRLAGRTLDLGRNTVTTTSTTVTIPSGLSTSAQCPNTNFLGCHWLGAIIDEDASLAEVDETNNATYVGIRVVP